MADALGVQHHQPSPRFLRVRLQAIRDRERPHGLPLPHHRTNGSRIRRFGRLSQSAQQTARASQPERLLEPRQRRLHPSHQACAPWTRRMRCRRSLASNFSSLSTPFGEPFGPSASQPRSPTMPSADLCLAVSANCSALSQFLSHARSQGTRQISQGKTQNVPRVDAEFIKHAPKEGWRTSRSRARSSRTCHTSDPVRVPRPAPLDWASFRPHLAMTPLPFS